MTLEKSWAQEHRKKAEVTEEYVEEQGNATKLGLIFFAGKKNLADSTQNNFARKNKISNHLAVQRTQRSLLIAS